MFGRLASTLSPAEIERTQSTVLADVEAGRSVSAGKGIKKLLRAQRRDRNAALALVRLVGSGQLSIDQGLEIFDAVFRAHGTDPEVVAGIGNATDQVRDIDDLNAPPPETVLFAELAGALESFARAAAGTPSELPLLSALATTTRMMQRQRDEVAGWSYRRLVELAPDMGHHHYNLGLFCKTRGLFREGLLANQVAARLVEAPVECYEWNLGICATGAGEGAVALDVWKRMSQKIELGRFELPEGRYPQCKVKLAERPLAERDAGCDDPGLQETIWIERLSPCHGIVRSALYQNLGVDFGDVVLFDGAPITHHTYGETQVPVFPHLATLVRRGYRFYDFAGTQQAKGQLADASQGLAADAVVYTHTEQYVVLCATCWRSEQTDHAKHEARDEHVVVGRIVAPPDIEPGELLRQLDDAIAARPPCRIYAPALCEAAGLHERGAVERRRFDMIVSAKGL
jgi:hypothetical protein